MIVAESKKTGAASPATGLEDAKADRPATLPSLFKNQWPAVFLVGAHSVDDEDLPTDARRHLQSADQCVVLPRPTQRPVENSQGWKEHIGGGRCGFLRWDDFVDHGVVEKLGVRVPLNDVETKRALILWRDCEMLDYAALTKLCDRLAINPGDTEYDVVYINGDHNLPTKLQASEADGGGEKELNIRQIEPEFLSANGATISSLRRIKHRRLRKRSESNRRRLHNFKNSVCIKQDWKLPLPSEENVRQKLKRETRQSRGSIKKQRLCEKLKLKLIEKPV